MCERIIVVSLPVCLFVWLSIRQQWILKICDFYPVNEAHPLDVPLFLTLGKKKNNKNFNHTNVGLLGDPHLSTEQTLTYLFQLERKEMNTQRSTSRVIFAELLWGFNNNRNF